MSVCDMDKKSSTWLLLFFFNKLIEFGFFMIQFVFNKLTQYSSFMF